MQAYLVLAIADCFRRIRRLFPFLLLLVLLPARAAFHSWAIISAGKGEEAALCDLVTAELSRVPDLALVEREALRQLTDEQLLSNALSADGVASRLRLGEMLNADALLVLRVSGEGNQRVLTVMVIDCASATRLRIEQFPWLKDNAQALADHLRDLVATIRRQYPDGVKRIIGIPNFVSRSFSRDYDPLQETYSLLLQQVLMLEPGVAVIDTGEAQAIGREMTLAGGKNIERILPLLVQGEFRVETPAGAAPTVTLSVKLTDKTGVIGTADSGPLALEKAPQWITTALPAKVIAGEKNAKPLPIGAQAQALNDRAEIFARLGSCDQSIPLRESAVLLDPNFPKARQALIDESFRMYSGALDPAQSALYLRYIRARDGNPGALQAPDFDRTVTDMVSGYIKALDHAEYVFQRRYIGPTAITLTLETLLNYTFCLQINRSNRTQLFNQHPMAQQQLAKADQARQRFLFNIIPVVMTYPDPATVMQLNEYDAFISSIYTRISELACTGIAHGGIARQDLPFIRQAAEAMPTGYYPLWITDYYDRRTNYIPDFTEEQYVAFLNELTGSTNALVRSSAKIRLLERRFQQVKGDKDQLLVLRDDLEKLGQELDAIPATYRTLRTHAVLLTNIRRKVEETLAQLNAAPAPVAVQKNISAVIFEKIELQGKPVSGPLNLLNGMHLIPCQGYDIIWRNDGRLYFHRTAGIFEPIQLPAGMGAARLIDVAWDGQVLWTMTTGGELRLFDAEGKYLGIVSRANGLLPYNEDSRLFMVDPGRVLAVGISDKDQRAWCATITWETKTRAATMTVFHEAMENPIATDEFDKRKYGRNPKSVFNLFHLFKLDGIVPGDGPMVGISRILVRQDAKWHLDPLTVNLKTLQVGIWTPETGLQALTYFQPVMLTANGELLGFDDEHRPSLRLTAATPAKTPKYRPIAVTNPGMAGPHGVGYPDEWNPQHIFYRIYNFDAIYRMLLRGNDDQVYVTGAKWWRIDSKSLTAQRLTTQDLPGKYYERMNYAFSSLLGIIAWNDTECYRVSIDETKIPKTGD